MVEYKEVVSNIFSFMKSFKDGGRVCDCFMRKASPDLSIICTKCGRQCNSRHYSVTGEIIVSSEVAERMQKNFALRTALSMPKGFEIEILKRLDNISDSIKALVNDNKQLD